MGYQLMKIILNSSNFIDSKTADISKLFYFFLHTMSDKELIQYILSHESFTTNPHYQNIIDTLWYTPPIQNISLINKTSRFMVYLTYSVTSENYALFKQAMWFGEIKMKVYNGKVEPPFTFIVSIKINKSDLWIHEIFIDEDSKKLGFYQEWNYKVDNINGGQEENSCKDSVSITYDVDDRQRYFSQNNCRLC